MRDCTTFYIDGAFVAPKGARRLAVENPATEETAGWISLGGPADVDAAVAAARRAFESWSATPLAARLELLGRIVEIYQKRSADLAAAITEEMGAPAWLAVQAQVPAGLAHLAVALQNAGAFRFVEDHGTTRIAKEPIGVCGFITPWNWPLNQIAAKFAPAFVTGCTMVLKPSEIAPFSAFLFAEIVHEAGVPKGVFNLVNGDGPTVGAALAAHPDVDMISFTGSTRAGVEVARAAAPTVKRVHQELGGKSPNILLDDADFPAAVAASVASMMMNSGQSCNAPSRLLAPRGKMREIAALAAAAADEWVPGDPQSNAKMGPVVSGAQWSKIQGLIAKGIEEGAELATGGTGKPEGLPRGWYVRPTVFSGVSNTMTIAREEIFGPVLAIIPYDDEDEAIRIGNDTEYGLSAYVHSRDLDRARRVASRLRAGNVHVNGAGMDFAAPFGGYKRSGNGREFGLHAFDEFLEKKAVMGYAPAA